MKKAIVIGKISAKDLRNRMSISRRVRFDKPLTTSLGSLLKAKGISVGRG